MTIILQFQPCVNSECRMHVNQNISVHMKISALTPQHPHKNVNLHQLSKPRQNIAFRYKSLKKKGKSYGIEVNLLRAAGT